MNAITLATIPAILASVNLGKMFGITGKWSTLLAVILGVVYRFIDLWAATGNIGYISVPSLLASGIIIGLSAAGLYDVAESINSTESTAKKGKHAQS